jgi:hypothetical protein
MLAWLLSATSAWAGPPYVADDPTPTRTAGYEIYAFTDGNSTRNDRDGAAGIDFNYGAARDLQLTAVIPLAWNTSASHSSSTGLGNVEVAAKYRFLHQADAGLDMAFFPRVLLPSPSSSTGIEHVALLLPLWIGHNRERWSTFGGGGVEVNEGGDSRSFWMLAWAVTRQVRDGLQLGGEAWHQSADIHDGHGSTGVDVGATWDMSEHFQLLASVGPGLQHTGQSGRVNWYASILSTF